MSSDSLRQSLARAIAREAGVTDAAVLDAFARVPRERFLGPPPWRVASRAAAGARQLEETSDPAAIYANVSVALDAERQLFNGAPAVAAAWLEALAVVPGETAVHLGCGTGYFSAVLSLLVGNGGTVRAIEIDESLIARAADALAPYPNVQPVQGDALTLRLPRFDVGLASLGVVEIPESWLTAMSPAGGRLALTLGVPVGRPTPSLMKGLVFLLERFGDHMAARVIGFSMIFAAVGHADRATAVRLYEVFRAGNASEVRSLRRDPHEPDESCWLHQARYCLSRRPVPTQ